MRKSPRYLVLRPRKVGHVAYYIVPERLRPDGWPKSYVFGPVRNEAELNAAEQWAREYDAKLDAARAGKDGPKEGTIPQLIRLLETDADNLDRWATLSEGSKQTYRRAFKAILKWSASVNHPQASALTPQGVRALYAQFGDRPQMRRLISAALSKLLDVAVGHGYATRNVIREMPLPPARSAQANRENIWPDEYFEACLNGAIERENWPLARALAFQRYHAQRPSDAVRLHTDWFRDGWLDFCQKKTNAHVNVPLDADFKRVLERAPAQIGPLVLDGDAPYDENSYRKAVYALQDELGLDRRQVKYLRHTGVLEMARVLTALQIAQRTGHSYANVTYILKHYLPQDEEIKKDASAKIERYRRNASRTRESNEVERNGGK